MATLIAVYNSDGCVGRCDAKCYAAFTAACHCICGGKNHGAGHAQAVENTRELAAEWLERYKRENNLGADAHGLISLEVAQWPLELGEVLRDGPTITGPKARPAIQPAEEKPNGL